MWERELEAVTGDCDTFDLTRAQIKKLLPRLNILKVECTPKVCNDIYNYVKIEHQDVIYTATIKQFLRDKHKQQWCKDNGKLYVP